MPRWRALLKALQLDPKDSEAACVQVQALSAAGKPAEAYAALDAFTGKDKGGWLHYYGAKAAIDAKDLAKAEGMLKNAKEKAVNSIPPEFFFMEARLDEAKGDHDAAPRRPDQGDEHERHLLRGWYELGRVEMGMAAQSPDRAKDLLDHAENHFSRALKGRPADPNSLYGVGYARYEQAKVMLLAQDDDAAHARMREAVGMFVQALEKQPDFAESPLRRRQYPGAARAVPGSHRPSAARAGTRQERPLIPLQSRPRAREDREEGRGSRDPQPTPRR